MTPTSEMITPSFLLVTDADNRTQPIIRHRRAAHARCHAVRHQDEALSAIDRAIDCRNQSFHGFRGDHWQGWRQEMREAALKFRKACGHIPGFKLTAK